MEKIKYGIIGFGGIAENRIAKEGFCLDTSRFEPHPHAELIGVTSRSEKRRPAAESLGLQWYETTEALLADPRIQAVFIASNNLSHTSQAVAAIEAGKHCLIDKPMATTRADAETIQNLAKERGLSLAVNHMMVFNRFNEEAASLVAGNTIGEVNDIALHLEFLYGTAPEDAAAWRCHNPAELGGPLGDVGSHCLYMAESLTGSSITDLACAYLPRTIDIAVENGAFVQFNLANGAQGTAKVAFNQPRGGLVGNLASMGFEIYGSEGAIRSYGSLGQLSGHSDEPFAIRLEVESADSVRAIKPQGIQNIYAAAVSRHAKSIHSGAPLDGADALHNLDLVLACHESALAQSRQVAVG